MDAFSADPECLGLVVRIVKSGLPDFSPAQIRQNPDFKKWENLQKCRRGNGADFHCVADQLFPAENDKMKTCFQKNEKCEKEIFRVCEKLQSEWSNLLFSGKNLF